MKYKGDTFNMWDTWYMNVDGRVHGFHLKEQPGDWSVGHVVTDDLLHFTPCPDILPPLSEETHPDDCLGKYTGCAYFDEASRKAYVYYTMRSRCGGEKIGVAVSEDMVNFPVYEHNPVLTVDPTLLLTESRPAGGANCRDMLVVKDPDSDRYYGYFAAMADVEGRGPVGVIAAAISHDLLTWTQQSVVYVPPFAGVIEVPDVFCIDGRWYLTYLTGNIYGAKGAISDPNPVRYTLCASADSPLGPFRDEQDNLLLCGGFDSGYACRSVEWQGKRYGLYIDRSCYGAAISLPKEYRVVDGNLKLCYADILASLRTGKTWLASAADFELQSTSFAWNTIGGHLRDEAGEIVVTTQPGSYQRYMARSVTASSMEVELTLCADCRECGVVLATADEQGAAKETYVFAVNTQQQELTVYIDRFFRSEYSLHSKRQYAFDKNRPYHLRVIAGEGQFEVYVDDVLALQGCMCTNSALTPGLFCALGTARFGDVHFYEWEN